MATKTIVIDDVNGPQNPMRPYRAETQALSAEDTSLAVGALGYALVGIAWTAMATAATATFEVSLDATTWHAHDSASIDVSTAGATSVSDLAEWPYFRVKLGAADTGTLYFALS